jgi:hypothetical protein
MRCFVRLPFCLSNLSFLKLLPWFFSGCYWGLWLGYRWMVFSLLFFDHFFIIPLGCLLSELVKYSHIERHLAAKIGTIFVVF